MTRASLLPALLLGLALAAPAFAQAPTDGSILKSRIDKVEKELRALQRAAAQGNLPAAGAGGSETAGGQTQFLADMEVRLAKLESELRSLTGTLEELSHRQTELEKTLDLFRQDVAMQLNDSAERGPAAGGGSGLVATETPGEQKSVLENETAAQRAEPAAEPVREARLTLPEGSVKDQYDFALSYLRKGEYASAEKLFQTFLGLHPAHELAGNAQYWLGETFYVRQNYPEAAQAFLTGFQKYPQGAKGPDNLLKLGLSLAAMGQTEAACSAYAELKNRYPNSPTGISARIGEEQRRLSCRP